MGLFSRKETEEKKLKRLAGGADRVAAMLMDTLRGPNGVDIKLPLLWASGLAGHACHRAVKELGGHVALITTKDGKKYYYGDAVNKYLLEDHLSVYSFVSAVSHLEQDKVLGIVVDVTNSLGTDRLNIWNMTPESVYPEIKRCWDGIYENMTARYCKDASEWPILFGLVTQLIILKAIQAGAGAEEAGLMAMQCAIVISKMDDDSL